MREKHTKPVFYVIFTNRQVATIVEMCDGFFLSDGDEPETSPCGLCDSVMTSLRAGYKRLTSFELQLFLREARNPDSNANNNFPTRAAAVDTARKARLTA